MIRQVCSFSTYDIELIERHIANKFGTISDIPGTTHGSIWTTFTRIANLISIHGQETRINQILDLGRKSNVKDSKDRIYGLLGLLPASIADQIHPDYDLSPRQVYTQFARAMLLEFNCIDALLSWCTFEHDPICPSWVPDWTTPFTRNHVQWLRKRQASGSVCAQWFISEDSQHLHVRGIIVDTVKSASRRQSEWISYKSEIVENPRNNRRSFPLKHHHYGSRENLSAALWRTLSQDHPNTHKRHTNQSILDIYWINWSFIQGIDPAHDQLSRLCHSMRNITSNSSWEAFDQFRHTDAEFSIFGYRLRDFSEEVSKDMKLSVLTLFGRKFVTTTNGYLGLAPEAVGDGNLIVVIYGCKFPVVLRQTGEFYSVIGECYVDGIMDGEIIETRIHGEQSDTELILC